MDVSNNDPNEDTAETDLIISATISETEDETSDPTDTVIVEVTPLDGPYTGTTTTVGNTANPYEYNQPSYPISKPPYTWDYPKHGIYPSWNAIVQIGGISSGGVRRVHIRITYTGTGPYMTHYDAVGLDSGGYAISFTPPSEDTTQIPEFSTFLVPVVLTIGGYLAMRRRRN
jgi:hypothetical protein